MKIKGVGFTLILVSLGFGLSAQAPPPLDTALIESSIFENVEVEASYPGGLQTWRKFLEKNLNASTPVENGAPEGHYTVLARFVVAKDGSVIDVKALTKIGYGMEEEVVRIIKKSGHWIPGIQNEKKVNSYHTQPVTFVVDDDQIEISTIVPNKLFAGINNRISIAVYKVKPEDLSVTVTNGKITPLGNSDFNVKPIDTTRRSVITVYNAKKKDKEVGAVSFEVRPGREAPDAKKD